jgi:hypothetical protein
MRCKFPIDECAKKCSAAEYRHQVLLFSLVLASSGIPECCLCGDGYGLTAGQQALYVYACTNWLMFMFYAISFILS